MKIESNRQIRPNDFACVYVKHKMNLIWPFYRFCKFENIYFLPFRQKYTIFHTVSENLWKIFTSRFALYFEHTDNDHVMPMRILVSRLWSIFPILFLLKVTNKIDFFSFWRYCSSWRKLTWDIFIGNWSAKKECESCVL